MEFSAWLIHQKKGFQASGFTSVICGPQNMRSSVCPKTLCCGDVTVFKKKEGKFFRCKPTLQLEVSWQQFSRRLFSSGGLWGKSLDSGGFSTVQCEWPLDKIVCKAERSPWGPDSNLLPALTLWLYNNIPFLPFFASIIITAPARELCHLVVNVSLGHLLNPLILSFLGGQSPNLSRRVQLC